MQNAMRFETDQLGLHEQTSWSSFAVLFLLGHPKTKCRRRTIAPPHYMRQLTNHSQPV